MRRNTSAAFGRLRIDSPRATPGSGRMSMRQRKSLRMQDHHGGVTTGGLSSSGSMQRLPVAETSPLLVQPPVVGSTTSGRILEGKAESLESFEMVGSPPLAVWIVPALCCAMAYALYNIFIKKGSYHINPVLGGVILQLVAALLGTCLLSALILREGADEVLIYNAEGIQWAVLAGISVGLAEIISFFVSSLGVQAMQSIPIIIGGSVMFGTVLGAVALHEELSSRGWIGVLLISIGISLVGMDETGDGSP
jgi:transporter family protein